MGIHIYRDHATKHEQCIVCSALSPNHGISHSPSSLVYRVRDSD